MFPVPETVGRRVTGFRPDPSKECRIEAVSRAVPRQRSDFARRKSLQASVPPFAEFSRPPRVRRCEVVSPRASAPGHRGRELRSRGAIVASGIHQPDHRDERRELCDHDSKPPSARSSRVIQQHCEPSIELTGAASSQTGERQIPSSKVIATLPFALRRTWFPSTSAMRPPGT